ncbi:MAG: polysaccharide biosynthesis protein [Megasphaera sp.]|jgi:stage V sporulation protein B|nr:polysaccharide biosynthesis protein [Megasphaera sp.]MCI1247462.1 polysaccharide biosynthesis protein [Megasphaera sp.]
MVKNTFLRGAMVLTMAGIVVKILGGANRILLSRLLGGEGIGLYQMAYPVYILFLSIAGAGIPIAVSIMVAEQAARGNYSGVKRIFHVTTGTMAIVAVACGIGMAAGSQALVHYGLIRDERALLALIVLSPALVISMMTCCFRGYFQGLQMMTPTAVSQMVDQFVRVCTMLALAWILVPYGLEKAAAGAAFGAVPGALAGLLVISLLYYRHSRQGLPTDSRHFPVRPVGSVLSRLAVLAIPVAAANMLLPAVSSIDVFIVPQRLEAAGYSMHEVTTMFGYLTGMANGLVQLPAILTIALATSLVPAVSAAFSGGHFDTVLQRTHTAMRIANTITIPACLGLAVLAAPISQLLYATAAAGPAISVLSIAVFLIGLQQITSGLLQGMGHTAIPLFNMAAAAVIKIVLSWHLTAIPWLAEVGAAWATDAYLAVATILNLYFAHRYIRYSVQASYIGKLFLAAAAMAGTAWILYNGTVPVLGNGLATVLAMVLAAVIYVICLFVFRAISAEDVARIPVIGTKIAPVAKRLGK